jgi:mannose-6-phosphate isomerase-like protein (cupin superfamily)
MSQVAGKVWGTTQLIFANGALEWHRITVKPHMRCSMHKHKYKFNGFFVESGELDIVVKKNDYPLTDVTTLEAGQFTTVKPGEYHQFVSRDKPVVAYEIYYAHFDHNDIEREDHGGPMDNSPNVSSIA